MLLMGGKKVDFSLEKHLPYVKKIEGGYLVKIGQKIAPPMEEKHYIAWIDLIVQGRIYRQKIKPAEQPEAFFL